MQEQPLSIEHIPLHCPVCSQRFMNILGQPLPNHTQIRCITSNGNEMDLGICESCIETGVSLEMVNAVLQGIKTFWYYEIDANDQMSPEEKQKRKDYHASHIITEIIKIIPTGKNAENEARQKGQLE